MTSAFSESGSHAESSRSGVSWPAIFAGAAGASALALVLLILGSGFGLSSFGFKPHAGASAAGLTAMAAVWLIIVQWVSTAVGGYLTGRLRCKWVGLHDHEVFFRDTAHGFLSWAVAAIISIGLVASLSAHMAGMGHMAMTAPEEMHGPASQMYGKNGFDPFASYVDTLFRSEHPATDANTQDIRAESERILMNGARQGGLSEEDRLYLTLLVSVTTGISSSDAETRVGAVLEREKQDEAKLRQIADDARKAASAFAIYTALSMLIGAFIASVAAALGGALRDKGWDTPLV